MVKISYEANIFRGIDSFDPFALLDSSDRKNSGRAYTNSYTVTDSDA